MNKTKVDYQTLSSELDSVISSLQQSDIQVDEAVKLYERGLELIKLLEKYLDQTENKLAVLKKQSLSDQVSI